MNTLELKNTIKQEKEKVEILKERGLDAKSSQIIGIEKNIAYLLNSKEEDQSDE